MPSALDALIAAQNGAAENLPARRGRKGMGRPKGSVTRGLTVQAVRELAPVAIPALREAMAAGDMAACAIWARIAAPTPRHLPQAAPIPGWPVEPLASPEALAQAVSATLSAFGRGELSADEADAALTLRAKGGKLATGIVDPEGEDVGNSDAHGALLDLIQRHAAVTTSPEET